jgi:hypothetical protein
MGKGKRCRLNILARLLAVGCCVCGANERIENDRRRHNVSMQKQKNYLCSWLVKEVERLAERSFQCVSLAPTTNNERGAAIEVSML